MRWGLEMSNLPHTPFPEVIDSSLLAAFRSCPTKANLEFFHHYKPNVPSVHLHAGKAFARGLEVAREAFFLLGDSPEEAQRKGLVALMKEYGDFECPSDSAKSLERMAGALVFYFDSYPLSEDKCVPCALPGGKKGIEFSFAEPMDILHPVTNQPLLYVGRMDMMAEYAGAVYGEDDKTTSQLGATWSRQWDLRSQFTSYCWGAQRAGYPLAGFIVRGISILKTKYDTQQAITYRPQWMIDRWYEQTLRDISRAIEMWKSGLWDLNLDHACTEYGGCIFRKVCLSSDPVTWLEADFQRRRWDPVVREEFPLEHYSV